MRSRPRVAAALLPLALAVLPACDISVGQLAGRATEEWMHTYPLSPGGTLRIGNTNGLVDVEGTDGTKVEIRAEKIARAATDSAARELLPRITIKEDVTPDRVSIETEKWNGMLLGAGFEVRYHVRAPRNAAFDVETTNGGIRLTDLTGKVLARTTNGGVRAKGLSGGVDARSTNGGVVVDMASLGKDPLMLRTTNGGVTLYVPESAKADLTASWTNGGMNVESGLKVEVSEQSRRRFAGRMNGGGTPVELHTTNGGIRIRPRSQAETDSDERDRQ